MKKIKNRIISMMVIGCLTAGLVLAPVGEDKTCAADVLNGLVCHLSFDGSSEEEQMWNKAPDSGCAAEKTGSGAVLNGQEGISGGMLYFGKQENSYLRLGLKDSGQALNASTDDFSVMAWVRFDRDAFEGGSDKINLFQQTADAGDPGAAGRTILYYTSDKKIGTFLTGNDVLCSRGIAVESWVHIALTCSHSDKKVRFYINGSMAGEHTLNGDFVNAATDILVGAHKNPEAKSAMKGRLDELRYYNRVAEADEIREVYREFAEEEQRKVKIEADANTSLREIPDAMFGINHRYHNNGYNSWNAAEQKIEEEFNLRAKEASFGSVRYPGGTVANLYDWKRAIGPQEERKKTIHGNTRGPIEPNFGVDEAMSWIYDDLDSEAVWVYAMAQGSAQDAADLFEYLNAPADGEETNPNGGIDWAEVRKANGHSEPYGVTRFEIGNEMGLWGQNYWMPGCGSSSYEEMARAYVNGGEMTFTKERAVQEEDWRDAAANGDGTKGQVKYARYSPVKEGSASVFVNNAEWRIVDSLQGQGAENVCEFDYKTGRITFGDGVNGNVLGSGQTVTVTYKSERDGFCDYYRELKNIAEELGMEVMVYSCMERESAVRSLQEAGGQYDGVVIHPYSETSGTGNGYIHIPEDDPEFYEKMLGRSLEHNISRVQNLKELMGEGKVPVISEFGIYKHNTKLVRSIGHAVYIANEMIDYIGLGTPYLNKHCLVDYPYESDDLGNGSQCVIQAIRKEDGSYGFVSTPSAKAFSVFNHMTGTEQIGQTLIGNETYYTFEQNGSYDVPVVKAMSTKDSDGTVYITAVNNPKEEETLLEISVNDRDLSGLEIEVWQLGSEQADDENTIENPEFVDVEKSVVTGSGKVLSYTLAPHSITSFKVPAENPAEKIVITTKAEAGGTAYGDIETEPGSEVTIQAVPDEGYEFSGWYIGEEKVSSNAVYTFTAEEDTAFTAKFQKKNEPSPPLDNTGQGDGDKDKTEVPVQNKPAAVGEIISDSDTDGKYQVISIKGGNLTLSYAGPLTADLKKYKIPGTVKLNGKECRVTSIGANAFKNNKQMTEAVIGENIETIGSNAFLGCSKLKKVTIGKDVVEIKEKAFYKTISLVKIKIPAKVKKIGKQAFAGAKKLKDITILTKKLTKKSVGKNAFQKISPKAKFKAPASKQTLYRKILRARGAGKKVKVLRV